MIKTTGSRPRLASTFGSWLLLGAALALGTIACGNNQAQPQYPEEQYPEEGSGAAEETDPGLAPEGPAEDPHEDPNAMPQDQPDTMSPPPDAAPGPQGALPQQSPQAAQVTSEEVDAFSVCYVRILELQETFQKRAQQGEPQQELQAEFQQQASAILDETGLSPQRYNEITRLIAQDPKLQQRVRKAIDAEAES